MGQCMVKDVQIDKSTDCLDSTAKPKDNSKANGSSK